ncbi:hypothetical protein [Streptomyces sp. NPDC051561]|uniref:hypothetical protein n=1 Tax=Streptomyces sp. NPDC051561 TaxID=3365658 RepID=UPI00378EF8C0
MTTPLLPSSPVAPAAPSRLLVTWPTLLRRLEYLACPAAAGAAFTVLALGVVTWLPALAALAHALQRWREEGDTRCFTGVFAAFPRYWRALWKHGLLSAVSAFLLAAKSPFLLGGSSVLAFLVLAAQAGIGAAFVIHHVALAARAERDRTSRPVSRRPPEGSLMNRLLTTTLAASLAAGAPVLTPSPAPGTYRQDFTTRRARATLTGPASAVVRVAGNSRIVQVRHDRTALEGVTGADVSDNTITGCGLAGCRFGGGKNGAGIQLGGDSVGTYGSQYAPTGACAS